MKNDRHRKKGHRCQDCTPDTQFELLPLEDVMKLQTDSDQVFSLKVFAAAFAIAMQEFEAEDSLALLESCSQEIARGHTIVLR